MRATSAATGNVATRKTLLAVESVNVDGLGRPVTWEFPSETVNVAHGHGGCGYGPSDDTAPG